MKRSYFFVRHARAVYQEKGFRREDHPPGTDWPLAPIGQAQAEEAAARVLRHGVERVISSRLARAVATAEALARAGRLPYEHRWGALNEIHPQSLRRAAVPDRWSWWEGWRAARATRRYVRRGRPEGTYDPREAEARVRGVLARLDEMPHRAVAVVSHGFFILLTSLLIGGEVGYRWIDNCSITRVDADGAGRYRLVYFARPTLRGR